MSTRTSSASGASSPTLRRACTRWDATHQDRRPARFTACLVASADPSRIAGASYSPSPESPDHDDEVTEPLTPLSRLPLDTGARFSRARRPIRRGRQDRFRRPFVKKERSSPVRGAFYRQGARCSFSTLSSGDCASCNPRACGRAGPGSPRAGVTRCSNTPREPVIGSSLPSAPLATRSFAAKSFERGARHKGRDASARLYIRRPGPRSPLPPLLPQV